MERCGEGLLSRRNSPTVVSSQSMNNAQIAKAFQRIADILHVQDENPFRIRAYERAAMTIEALSEDVEMIYTRKGMEGLLNMNGIGEDLAAKIEEILKTGKLKFLAELEKKVPAGLLDILEIEGLGPKKAKMLWQTFKVKSVEDLEKLAQSGKLTNEKGWGEKSVENILKGIAAMRLHHERVAVSTAMSIAQDLKKTLEESGLCGAIEIAGSLRRRKETIGDIDLLATSGNPEKVMDLFCTLPSVDRVLAKGTTKSSVHLSVGLDADLRVVDENVFGAALHYFTGSKEHNIHVRRLGIEKGFTISEYGVYEGTAEKKGTLLASKTEKDVYKAVGLPYIEPELREDRGEIEAASEGKLPDLIEEKDLKGDLHIHSNFSDGTATMVEMAGAAKERGFEYIVFCDHASPMGMVHGVKEDNIGEYLAKIEEARSHVPGIEIFAGAEVDIMEDGSLYLPDAALAKLDWVVASVHAHFKMTNQEMTKRIVRALENPHVRLLGHPTARLLLRRDPIDYNFDEVAAVAAKRGIAMEINASVFRLDLNDVNARRAKEAGAKIAINTDAHHPRDYVYRYGVSQARRGWIEKGDVINAMDLKEFMKYLKK